ncbi:hypothetical protein F7725_022469 [Dissostichus mawsoni]|uniref:Uncharacterized protein n=1 Tax=Dissostichus mawsoni TaxID=36200 RepID=A0A7J5YXU1_DISMA|nr:hypothetical protein F7725_022469 [Dissostichus mawsoni]
MCEQAARYCRDGVHKLLNKEQAKLRAESQESREQPNPVAGQDSESATAAQSGNSGAQPGGIDGLVRWIVTKMSDNKNISSREFASSKEDVAVAQEQFFAPEPRRGISVILDVSMGSREAVVSRTGYSEELTKMDEVPLAACSTKPINLEECILCQKKKKSEYLSSGEIGRDVIVSLAKQTESNDTRAARVLQLTVQEQGIIKYHTSSCYRTFQRDMAKTDSTQH